MKQRFSAAATLTVAFAAGLPQEKQSRVTLMNSKSTAILDRIKHLEQAIAKGSEYLETGKHAHWHGFRPLFAVKVSDGKTLPPHKDWVKNVFLPRQKKALRKARKKREKLI